MSSVPTNYDDLSSAIASACDRFVHPDMDGEARVRRGRFVGVMLLAPILIAGSAIALIGDRLGASAALATVLFTLATGWFVVLVAAGMRAGRWLEPLALAFGVPLAAALLFAAGGIASPAALLLIALPFEAWWVARCRLAVVAGGVALALASGLGVIAGIMWPSLGGTAASWHWLLPLAYLSTVLPRVYRPAGEAVVSDASGSIDRAAAICGGMVLDLQRSGDVAGVRWGKEMIPGLAPDLVRGGGLFERIHVADRIGFMCAMGEVRDGRNMSAAAIRLRVPREAGTAGPDDYQPFAIQFHPGEGGGFVAVLRDTAEMERLRAALDDSRDENAALEVAKGRFLAAVSHELRTPLNAIIGFSDILLHREFGGFIDQRQREYAELIKESGHHLLGIVNSILDVSKIEAGTYAIQTEAFAFADAVDMCRSMMSLQAEKKRVDLRTEIGRTIGDIVADRRAVQQILINLVSNAVKFTPEHGTVTIGARRLGSRLHFWVEDTGIGISEADLERIGKPFTQVRNDYTRQFEGTGLGLSLVKGLIALHEGTMSIESAPGEGTKVAVSLPVDGPRTAGNDSAPAAAPREVKHDTLRKTA